MKFLNLVLLFILISISTQSFAQNAAITIDMPSDHIDITTGFSGSRLSIFGIRGQKGDVAIVLRGPSASMVIRRKESLGGIWMNRDSVKFENVPVYYDYALSVPETTFEDENRISDFRIGISNLDYRHTGREDAETVSRFREALVRKLQGDGLFPLEPKRIQFRGPQFFRVDFDMPADVPTGIYTIHTYLFNEGEMIAENRTSLRVAQIGFNARLYNFAHRKSLFYGLLCVIIAISMGWGVHSLLRRE